MDLGTSVLLGDIHAGGFLWRNPPSLQSCNRMFIAVHGGDTQHRIRKQAPTMVFTIWLAFFSANAWPLEYHSLQDIRQVALQFLQSSVEDNGSRTHVQIGELDSRLRLSLCDSPLVPFLPPGVNPSGNITVGIRCSGSKPWKLYVSATIKTYARVVVLNKALPRYSKISAEDVRLDEHDVTHVTTPLLSEEKEAVGKHLIRSVSADQPLTYSVLKNPIVVRRGERVTLLYKSPGIEVRGSGTALEEGSTGKRISVKPHGAPRMVDGVVLQPGIILVSQTY